MRSRKRIRPKRKPPSSKVRKPVPPPTKVEEPPTTYRRARERERLRREEEREKERGEEETAFDRRESTERQSACAASGALDSCNFSCAPRNSEGAALHRPC